MNEKYMLSIPDGVAVERPVELLELPNEEKLRLSGEVPTGMSSNLSKVSSNMPLYKEK